MTSTIRQAARRCRESFDLVGIAIGLTVFTVGVFFSASVIGAVIGIPLILVALPLLTEPKRTVCA